MEKSRKENNYPSKAKKYKRRLLFYLQKKKNLFPKAIICLEFQAYLRFKIIMQPDKIIVFKVV